MSSWGNRNRGVGRDGNRALTSGRIGPTGLRSYHNKLTPLKGSGRGRIAYIHGLDESREDIVLTDGKSIEEIEKIASHADRCDEQARELVGVDLPGASAYTNIVELPREVAELTQEKLAEMCNAIANELVAASRRIMLDRIPTTWAVHRAGKNDNMHLHIVAVVEQRNQARPRLIDGSEKMMTWRQAVAGRINESCGTQWHGGTLADTGILDRPAKKRLPTALYKAREEVAGWRAEYEKDSDFLPEKTRKDPKARVRRIKLAKAAGRVEKKLDDQAQVEWLEAKQKREEQAEAAKAAALRDPGTGPVSPEVHQELEARGLTTLRRSRATAEKARQEGRQQGREDAQKALQRPSKGPPGVER